MTSQGRWSNLSSHQQKKNAQHMVLEIEQAQEAIWVATASSWGVAYVDGGRIHPPPQIRTPPRGFFVDGPGLFCRDLGFFWGGVAQRGGGVDKVTGGLFVHNFFGGVVHRRGRGCQPERGGVTLLPVAHGLHGGPWWSCVTHYWLFVNLS